MAIIKCKMCGGDLEIAAGVTVAECEYCGTKQTLPKVNDEVIQNLFNRANNLRIKCEFDKAEQIYEKILQENAAESEAHWGIVLCKYGIEYVEDPKTFKRIPTCHRTSYDAVTTDADYLAAIEHADTVQKGVYEAEAKAIDAIQKDILNIVKNEKPFDVFICYKETDENGKRTVDSVIANDIYYQLTQEGLKVFYAAITLEDKLGQEYEPYIFAALNSAKVMLVIGTKPQYFSAVWVKNEWSRFLKLMKEDRSKLLIPCYKDMDAYDLPEEFSHLQAQDMGKIGFINDVVRGIRKVAVKEEPKAAVAQETVVVQQSSVATDIAPLLKRAFMFLEDCDWKSANEYCEKVLDIDPECAQAYLGKLMAELRASKQEYLKDYREPFDNKNNYQKTIRFADEKLKSSLADYIKHIHTRNENNRLNGIYTRAKDAMEVAETEDAYKQAAQQFETIPNYQDAAALAKECYELAQNCVYTLAKNAMEAAKTEDAYKQAAQQFETIPDYQDAATLAQECYENAEIARKDAILAEGKAKMTGESVSNYEAAITLFESISGWKDADAEILACQKKIEEIEAKAEADRLERERQDEIARKEAERKAKRNKRITIITTAAVCAVIAFVIILNVVIIPNGQYNDAMALMNDRKYTEAIAEFEALDGFRDSADKITECNTLILDGKYNDALALMNEGKYTEAIAVFEAIDGHKDSADQINECNYNNALALLDNGNIAEARNALLALGDYKDCKEQVEKINKKQYDEALQLYNDEKYEEAIPIFKKLGTYKDADALCSTAEQVIADYNQAILCLESSNYQNNRLAYELLQKVGNYKDAEELLNSFDFDYMKDNLLYDSSDCYNGTNFPTYAFYEGKEQSDNPEPKIKGLYHVYVYQCTESKENCNAIWRYESDVLKKFTVAGTMYSDTYYCDDNGNLLCFSHIVSPSHEVRIEIIPEENVAVFLERYKDSFNLFTYFKSSQQNHT